VFVVREKQHEFINPTDPQVAARNLCNFFATPGSVIPEINGVEGMKNIIELLVPVLVGGSLGAVLGYFGQCSSGTCPLTSTWWRGSIYGAIMGLIFVLMSGNSHSKALNPSSPNVIPIEADAFDSPNIVFIPSAPAPLVAPHNLVPAGLNAPPSQTNFQAL
jgi:hypothetical protein